MGLLSKIWVPRSAKPAYQCNVPGCDAKFYENESVAYERHVARCAAANHDTLKELHDAKRPPGLFQPFDREYFDWVRKHGRVG